MLEIPAECAGLRLDQALARLLPEHSRSRLAAWVKQGKVSLNDTAADARRKVWGGERVAIAAVALPEEAAQQPEDIPLTVVYEDGHVLVVNKPAGLVAHPGSGNWQGTLLNALLHHAPQLAGVPRAGIVHRLDKDTSGLLVVAKTLEAQTDLVMGTFSKSFASLGGFVAGKKDIIHYIRHRSRSFMFSAALPPANAATVLECLKIVQEDPGMIDRLWRNARKMKKGFEEIGFDTMGSQTPVIPVLIGDDLKAFMMTKRLYELGVFCTPVVSPAVPKGYALIRTSYMATHEDQDLDYVLDAFAKVGKEFGVLQQ
ncbi:MAG: aminotransferase class I/II-fold pyridoxal phosphate-dependent enzyme [Bdellovibrionales bacterium]|nr:aminotransferase class I/II-fold pyridoxal phosphate-dependent enzyme [Bdellovibrionales bacterium]